MSNKTHIPPLSYHFTNHKITIQDFHPTSLKCLDFHLASVWFHAKTSSDRTPRHSLCNLATLIFSVAPDKMPALFYIFRCFPSIHALHLPYLHPRPSHPYHDFHYDYSTFYFALRFSSQLFPNLAQAAHEFPLPF